MKTVLGFIWKRVEKIAGTGGKTGGGHHLYNTVKAVLSSHSKRRPKISFQD